MFCSFNVVRMRDTHLHCASDGALMVEADVYAGTHVPLCNLLNKCLPLTIEENILPKQYAKLLLNLGNAVNALSGIPIKEMVRFLSLCRFLPLSVPLYFSELLLSSSSFLFPQDLVSYLLLLLTFSFTHFSA